MIIVFVKNRKSLSNKNSLNEVSSYECGKPGGPTNLVNKIANAADAAQERNLALKYFCHSCILLID